ncbi:MAG: hypothetical protein HY518_03785 [Candidatus Aenigmarchaeota archaeon]|nr:hypothetical protein [Candidatus Aenigmarchaeota archaeon]
MMKPLHRSEFRLVDMASASNDDLRIRLDGDRVYYKLPIGQVNRDIASNPSAMDVLEVRYKNGGLAEFRYLGHRISSMLAVPIEEPARKPDVLQDHSYPV